MSSSVLGMINYANLFTSPFKAYESTPTANLIYGSFTSKLYSDTISKNLQDKVSKNIEPLKSLATYLQSAASNLVGEKGKAAFEKKSLESSDSSSIGGIAKNDAAIGSYKIKVSQLASAQSNQGNSLAAQNTTAFTAGSNTIEIKNGGLTKKVSFDVAAGESNQGSLEKMATAINGSKTGLLAKVITDKEKGTSYLSVSSETTGKDNGFTIEDKYGGNAVAVSSANKVEKEAQDAKYTVEGKEYRAASNTVALANGKIEITFNKAQDKELAIQVSRNSASIDKSVREFISQYNQVVTQAAKNNQSKASQMIQQLDNAFSSNKSSLESLGITRNTDSTLSVDNQKFENAVSKDFNSLSRAFNPQNGLAKRASDIGGNMMYSPANYSKTTQLNQAGLTGMYVDMFI